MLTIQSNPNLRRGNKMGYTQYWLLKSEGSEKNYKLALADIRKILAAKKNLLAGGDGNGRQRAADRQHAR